MIWVHTYGFGKFGRKVKQSIHTSEKEALYSQSVLGGTVERFYSDADVGISKVYVTNAVNEELSEIIDDFSKHDPVFYGSSGWDCKKIRAINTINQIIERDY